MAKIAFIGGGNMASSLIGGMIKQGFSAADLIASDPLEQSRKRLATEFGIATSATNDCAAQAEVVVLAVKPQIMKPVATDLAASLGHRPLVMSIAAGITIASLQSWLGTDIPLVRCMPNTPALLQKGASGLYASAAVNDQQRARAEAIMAAVGTVNWFDNEDDIDRVTALSGSGPAYFFLVMEAMENAGANLGLDRQVARQLTIQTALGAAAMAARGDVEPAELRARVTSPGGTTEAAVNSLINADLSGLFEQAITAAFQRSVDMAKEAK